MPIDELKPVTEEMVNRALDAADYCRNHDTAKWMRAALEAAFPTPTAADTPECQMVPVAALKWLNGEGPDPAGFWFGDFPEDHPKPAGQYWWRSYFNAMIGKPKLVYNKETRTIDTVPAAADTWLVERLTASLKKSEHDLDMVLSWAIAAQGEPDLLLSEFHRVSEANEAAEQREAAAREQIAALERERDEFRDCLATQCGKTLVADNAFSSAQETISRMKALLMEARNGMNEHFASTDEGIDLNCRIDAALTLETQG